VSLDVFYDANLAYIVYQDADGEVRDTWPTTAIRITDLAVTPDLSRLVAVGMQDLPPVLAVSDLNPPRDHNGEAASTPVPSGSPPSANGARGSENRMIIYDLATKETQSYVHSVVSFFFSHCPTSNYSLSLLVGRYALTVNSQA
jgi:hypothetical protein